MHGADEEIFFVLAGSGLSWQDGETYEVRRRRLPRPPRRSARRTRSRGGDDGLEVLAYGRRTADRRRATCPKVGIYWLWPSWAEVGRGARTRSTASRELEWPEPLAAARLDRQPRRRRGRVRRPLEARSAQAAGATQSGPQLGRRCPPNEEGAPPHCHSAEEELFVVLDGEGTLELWRGPQPRRAAPDRAAGDAPGPPRTRRLPARGHRASRTAFRAGEAGLTYLAYGTREPNDICYYPRSNKVFFRGLGLIARLEPLEYSDGEPS